MTSAVHGVRIPHDVWAEVCDTAAKHGRKPGQEVVERLRRCADPEWRPPQAEGQTSLSV